MHTENGKWQLHYKLKYWKKVVVHFSPLDYSIFSTFSEWTGAGDFFPSSQGPSKPFESAWKPVSNSKCNNTVSTYGEREQRFSKTNVQTYRTPNPHIYECVTALSICCVLWFSVPSHMGTFQRNYFYFLPRDIASLFPGLPETSFSGCDDAPVPHTSRTQLFTALVFPGFEFPPLLSWTAGVTGTWELRSQRSALFSQALQWLG